MATVDDIARITAAHADAAGRAIEAGFDYAYLLNQDCVALPGFLEPAIALAEADPTIGAVQSRILLHDDPARLMTVPLSATLVGTIDRPGDASNAARSG